MTDTTLTTSPATSSSTFRIAFIQACWHRDIVDQCRDSFLKEIALLTDCTVECIELPGAFEIPLHAKLLIETGNYDAVVAAGLVTDSGIYRHEFVAHAVIDGLMRVQLDTGKPVFSAVLTPHQFHNYDEHINFFINHFVVKGKEAAEACANTLTSMKKLSLL